MAGLIKSSQGISLAHFAKEAHVDEGKHKGRAEAKKSKDLPNVVRNVTCNGGVPTSDALTAGLKSSSLRRRTSRRRRYELDDEEDENESELTFPYEETDPLNPPPPASDLEPEDVIEVENTVELEDETVPASVHEIGESSIATFLQEDGDRLLPGFMRRDIDSLFGRIASISRQLCGRETAHALVEKKGKAKDKCYERAECKKLKKELEDTRSSNILLSMQKERVERDLYWTRVQAHEFYREMIRRGVVFEERPNEAIDVPVEDEESPSSELRGSPRDSL
ncbi:hypothetical protein Tco_0594017 [Tanacetum coccineum]